MTTSIRFAPEAVVRDIGAVSIDLRSYVLIRETSDATLTGFFVDIGNHQLGAAITPLVISSTPNTLIGFGVSIPDNATGFRGQLTGGDLNYGLTGDNNGAFTQTPDNTYPKLYAATDFRLGRT